MDIVPFHVPHFSKRESEIDAIVLHDTGGSTARGALEWFNKPESKVSAHFVIDKDGTVYECVEVEDKAWHAGRSSLFGRENVNDFSIGIEIVDDDDADRYPPAQISALTILCTELCSKYEIPLNRVVGHLHIAPGRKGDPGPDFPWFEFLLSLGTGILQHLMVGEDE